MLLFSIAFFGIYLCAYAPFFQNGKGYIWNYDGIKQHYAALVYLGRYYREVGGSLLRGEFALPMFDFSIGMGEDVITTLNFYGLGDPLTLLAAFVPDSHIESLYNFLVVFRMYLAGLSFAWMCREKGTSGGGALLGALVYCFSGYVLHVAVKHPFFVIPMIFLPLAVVGVERVLMGKKLTLLIVVVFLTALNGFYFFYMNTIFLAVYAVVYVACRRPHPPFRSLGRCVVAYVVGVMMSAVLFLPTVAAFLSSARSGSAVDPGNLFFFSLKRYAYIFSRLVGTPRITWDYMGMASVVIPALVVLFSGSRKKDKELKANIIIWSILMLLPAGGYVLNGFSYVSGRFTYLVAFVYAMGFARALPELFRLSRRRMIVCLGAAVCCAAAVIVSGDGRKWYGWFGFVMLAATLAVLVLGSARKWKWGARWNFGKEWGRKLAFCLLAVTVALNLVGNGWLLFWGKAQGYVDEFVDEGTALSFLEQSPETEALRYGMEEQGGQEEGADSFFRVDASEKRTENAAMVSGFCGVSSYFSISNPNRLQYLFEMDDGGVLDSMFKIDGLDGRTYLEALASVKYYVAPEGREADVPYGYQFVREYTRKGKKWKLFENENFLPLGITYDSYIRREDVVGQNGIKRQEGMLKTVVLDEDAEGLTRLSEMPESDVRERPVTVVGASRLTVDGDEVRVKPGGGTLTVEWGGALLDERESNAEGESEEKMAAGELYVSLDGFEITQKNRSYCDITMSCGEGKKTIRALGRGWNWYFGRGKYLLNMGIIKNNTCRIHFSCGGTFSLSDLRVYEQNLDQLGDAVSERRRDVLGELSVGTNRVGGAISLTETKLVFLSIPYSSGWRATVDGKAAKIYRADTAYMAILVEPGRHRVELTYETPYLGVGGIVTLLGVVAFVRYLVLSRRRRVSKLPRSESGRSEAQGGVRRCLPDETVSALEEIRRRLQDSVGMAFTTEERERAKDSLRQSLAGLDAGAICQAKMRPEEKIYLLSLKIGRDARSELTYRKGNFFYREHQLYSLRSKKLFSVDVLAVEEGKLKLSGRIWCPLADALDIYFEDDRKQKYPVCAVAAGFRRAVYFGEEVARVRGYEIVLPLDGVRKYRVCGRYRGQHPFGLYIRDGKFSHLSREVEELYYADGGYMVGLEGRSGLWIRRERVLPHLARECRLLMRCVRDHKYAIAGYRVLSRLLRPVVRRERWIVMERAHVAGDNAEYFYRYLKESSPGDVKSYFVISRESADYARVGKLGGVIPYRGFRHRINMLLCKYVISSQGEDSVFNAWDGDGRYIRDLYRFGSVFLQHGIIKDDLSAWLNRFNKNLRMFVTSAEPEYRSILEGDYFYDESVVKLTGLPRYDTLKQDITPEKSIVFMPTWRSSLAGPVNPDTGEREYNPQFKESRFFRFYNRLLQDERLIRVLRANGYTARFVLHPHHRVQARDFTGGEMVRIVRDVDYQEEFMRNALLITDFSSVAFDFAYLKKPVIYTQFDADTFFQGQLYEPGYFDYERDGLGPVCVDYEATLQAIIDCVERGCRPEALYEERGRRFYRWFDCGNCERVYEAIRSLD